MPAYTYPPRNESLSSESQLNPWQSFFLGRAAPQQCILPSTLAAPVIGMAQGGLEAFEERLNHRRVARERQPDGRSSQLPPSPGRDGGRGLGGPLHPAPGLSGNPGPRPREKLPTMDDRARYRRDQAYVATLCVRAINRLFEVSGGHGLFESNPLQRFHRDPHAASHHMGIAWDVMAEQYGLVGSGLEPNTQIIWEAALIGDLLSRTKNRGGELSLTRPLPFTTSVAVLDTVLPF